MANEIKALRDDIKTLQDKNDELVSLVMVGFQTQSTAWSEILSLKAVKESTRRELDLINESKNMTHAEIVSLKSAVLNLNRQITDLQQKLTNDEILINSYNKKVNELENTVYYGFSIINGILIADLMLNIIDFFKKK